MNVSSNMHRDYPSLCPFIYDLLGSVPRNRRVWTAFLRYAQLTSTAARQALMLCSAVPIIDYKTMPGANGQFNGAVDPDRVYLAKAICDRFEGTPSDRRDPRMRLLIESTLLHELVHWGDYKDGRDQAGEEGKAFERDAYGRDIGRYW